MTTTKIPLDLINVASPCTASWDAMSGDDTTRFCGQCAQYVYNLSEMTQAEAEAVVIEHEGHMCVRYYKRADGTMMTKDCPVGWRAVKHRFALIGAAAGAVFVAMFGLLTVGVAAASVRGNGRGGVEVVNPVARLWHAMFGRDEVQGGMEPVRPGVGVPPPGKGQMVMGDMCPPQPVQGGMGPIPIELQVPQAPQAEAKK